MTTPLTPEVAWREARAAGNKSARLGGRRLWNWQDFRIAEKLYNRLMDRLEADEAGKGVA